MKDKIFVFLKKIYKKLPINYKQKNKLKGVFYRLFGFMFKNTTSYRVWNAMNVKDVPEETIKVSEEQYKKVEVEKKIAIQLHLFYVDLANEFKMYFDNMPFKFDLLVSMVDESEKENVVNIFSKVKNVEKIEIRIVKNRGRDVAPLISSFGNDILKYEYICHIHSKKSLFTGGEQTAWRKHLLDALLGSTDTINKHFYLFEKKQDIGLIYPETFETMPYWGHTWLKNKSARDELLLRIGVLAKSDNIYIDYPMGTMFWARVEAIKQFFEAKIKTEEFPKEGGQIDGTIAHAFERCLGVVTGYNGYNLMVYDDKQDVYAINYGAKNFGQYYVKNTESLKHELSEYDVVSFDIFDTLTSRRCFEEDVLDLVELKIDSIIDDKTNFKEKRLLAEANLRNRYPDKDCDIDEIYDELSKDMNWDNNQSQKAKEIEIETQKRLICPKEGLVEVLKYVKHQLKKEVNIISDMYLKKSDIEDILSSIGVKKEDYNNLYVSSDTDKRKDNEEMWRYYKEIYNDKKLIHIGDNEVADVQIPGDMGIANYHVMSNKSLFQVSDLGKVIRKNNYTNIADRVQLGIILNKSFKEPFAYNDSKFKVKFDSPREIGFSVFGPIILNYILWIIRKTKESNISKVLFCSREGYLLRQVYDLMANTYDLPKSEYVYVSRRALSMATIYNEEDISIPLEIYYEGKLKNLIEKRYGLTLENVTDDDIKLPDDKNKVLKVLKPYEAEILKRASYERGNYKAYLENILTENCIIADIGYSGTIQYLLSKLTGLKFDGMYMATDEKKKPEMIGGNKISGYYIDGDFEQEISKSFIHRYHLILESVLIAPDGQLKMIGENGKPVFEQETNELYDENIKEIHSGILDFANEYAQTMSSEIFKIYPERNLAEGLMEAVVRLDIIEKNIADSIKVDDKYCSGEILNAVDYYKKVTK